MLAILLTLIGLLVAVVAQAEAQVAQPNQPKPPKAILQAETYVCTVLVYAKDSNQVSEVASGALLAENLLGDGSLKREHRRFIATAFHVFSDHTEIPRVLVTWDGQKYVAAELIAANKGADCAILAVSSQQLPKFVDSEPLIGLSIAKIPPVASETVWLIGFDGKTQVLRTVRASFHGTGGDITQTFTEKPVVNGMSGGPAVVVRDNKPKIIGPLLGYRPENALVAVIARPNVLPGMFEQPKQALASQQTPLPAAQQARPTLQAAGVNSPAYGIRVPGT